MLTWNQPWLMRLYFRILVSVSMFPKNEKCNLFLNVITGPNGNLQTAVSSRTGIWKYLLSLLESFWLNIMLLCFFKWEKNFTLQHLSADDHWERGRRQQLCPRALHNWEGTNWGACGKGHIKVLCATVVFFSSSPGQIGSLFEEKGIKPLGIFPFSPHFLYRNILLNELELYE